MNATKLSPLLCAALALASACGPKPIAEQVAEGKPAIDAKLDALAALAAPSKAAPPVASDTIVWPAADANCEYRSRNTIFVHLEELDDLGRRLDLPLRANNRSPWADVAHLTSWKSKTTSSLADDTRYDFGGSDPKLVEVTLSEFAATKYALVLRTSTYVPAKMVAASEFEPGAFEGDVLVFEVDGARLLGGYRVTAKNQSSVGTREGRNYENLKADLHFAVFGSVAERLSQLTPALAGKHVDF